MEHVVVEPDGDQWCLSTDGGAPQRLGTVALCRTVQRHEAEGVRWVWDTAAVVPALLAGGVRVARAHDLRLGRALLRRTGALGQLPEDRWDGPGLAIADGLFDLMPPLDAAAEWARQQRALTAAPARMRTLVHADSSGALAAAEMRAAGLPWRADVHERLLTDLLGPRPRDGERPARIERLVGQVRAALNAPSLNPDSAPELLRALHRAGIDVRTTRSGELERVDHPVVPPLLELKRLTRLFAANGWHWLDRWIDGGRFRPDYVVAGVPTGRWATSGGGALQLPKQLRAAVVADPGHVLVVADAAQLEPRVLAGLARDTAMADAGRGRDLYDGIVAAGAAPDRPAAKIAVLGALYGATSGAAGALMPRLAQRFPDAVALVERAARTGEAGGVVETLLGRPSPPPSAALRRLLADAAEPGVDAEVSRRARTAARDQGRFTRNFVVQGTAAEWALAWLADLRRRLLALGAGQEGPQLVYFLHDEVVVHTPAALADAVVDVVQQAAARAGRVLFADFPVDFPLDVRVVRSYADADGDSDGAQQDRSSLVP